MKIAILKERRPHETRVAATPETVKKLKALGAEEIVIEAGAGTAAAYTDQAYSDAGAMIVPDAATAVSAADVIFKIQRPMAAADGLDELALLRQGQTSEAITQYTAALRLKPNFAQAHYNLGVALADQGHLTEARWHFSEVLRLDPSHAKARRFLRDMGNP